MSFDQFSMIIRRILKPGTRASRLLRGIASDLDQSIREYKYYINWLKSKHPIPAPPNVKREVLKRHAPRNSIWIETGTYHGDTTSFLSRNFEHVYSIEPEESLFIRAVDRFHKRINVTLVNRPSEYCLKSLLDSLNGTVAFWLDGHLSEPGTFKGASVTPLLSELKQIEYKIKSLSGIAIFIDDARLLHNSILHQPGYPGLTEILKFAEKHNLKYSIEHDIVILVR